jgi:hypothetical protein
MLRQREQALRAELQAIADQANDRAAFLRLAEILTSFLTRLRSAAESLSVLERQKIVRLLVKEILVGDDTITIRHSIPIPSAPPQDGGSKALSGENYLLCKGRDSALNWEAEESGRLALMIQTEFPGTIVAIGGPFTHGNTQKICAPASSTGSSTAKRIGRFRSPASGGFAATKRWTTLSVSPGGPRRVSHLPITPRS